MQPMSKLCMKCKETKPLSSYFKDKHRKSGVSNQCKLCYKKQAAYYHAKDPLKRKEAGKRWREKNPMMVRNAQLKHRYGIDINDYDKLFIAQNGNCAICGVNQSKFKRRLSVDHCHKTLKIRGLLCDDCNVLIGLANDNELVLSSAINYLNNNR